MSTWNNVDEIQPEVGQEVNVRFLMQGIYIVEPATYKGDGVFDGSWVARYTKEWQKQYTEGWDKKKAR